jgi:hypothetical protein
MKKILLSIVAALLIASPVAAYTVKKGDTPFKLWGASWKTELAKFGISDPTKLPVGLETGEKTLGAYNPVTAYSSRTTAYVSASATTIPVASTLDAGGSPIVLSNISSAGTVKVYMNLAAGTTSQEPIMCTGVTSASWTGCVRGLTFQGSSEVASTTLQKAHNAGTPIIITNIGQFFNQYVSIDGAQTINDIKTFSSFPLITTSTALPTTNGQLATKYYVDTVGAGGFTSVNVSTTRGLSVDGSSPEKVGINASSTTGGAFDSSGKLYQKIDTTTGVQYSSGSAGIGINTSTLVSLIASTTPTANLIPIASSTGYLDSWVSNQYFFGLGSDGDVIISSGTTTLTRDMFYNNLTVTSTGGLLTNGYRIFVKETLTLGGTGTSTVYISHNASTAPAKAGRNSSAGVGGIGAATGTLYGGLNGVNGGNAYKTGIVGTSQNGCGSDGKKGGIGGGNYEGGFGDTGGTAAAAGAITTTTCPNQAILAVNQLIFNGGVATLIRNSAVSSGGSGGGDANGGNFWAPDVGAGGGSGGQGGTIMIAAKNILGYGTIQVKGGEGGEGGDGVSGGVAGGGGGGGGGGQGGNITFIYKTKSSNIFTDVTGGLGGAGGAGAGGAGSAGETGNSGFTFNLPL